MILFRVQRKGWRNIFICSASNREDAKREAAPTLMGNPDEYTVTPLTQDGDRVFLQLQLKE